MDEWSTPMHFFFDGLIRCWMIELLVYWIIRNVLGHALQMITNRW